MVEAWIIVVIGVVAAILAIALVWTLWYFGAARRTVRTLRTSPLVCIGDAREGVPNRISGQAAPWQQTLAAPLTGRPCVYYEATIHQHVRRGARDHVGRWVLIAHEVIGVPFVVEDETGRAIIDPMGATVALAADAGVHAGASDPWVRAFVDRYHLEPQDRRYETELRFCEAVIAVGETVTALGDGVREPDPEGAAQAGGYRDAGPMRLRLSGNAKRPLYLTDRAVGG